MNIQFRIEKLKSVFSVMLYVRISYTILHSVMTKDTAVYDKSRIFRHTWSAGRCM